MQLSETAVRHDRDQTRVQAGWFGDERSLFGWLHLPAGKQARGGVVLFPPLAYDYRVAYPTFRVLAEQLAACGLAVLRFDYDGTGDSAGGPDDPDRIEAWLRSGECAVQLLRDCGLTWIAAVGMRVGAPLAAMVAERSGYVDALVLWDPLGGRRFVSEQKALARLTFGASDQKDGSVEIPGLVLAEDTVRHLRQVDVAQTAGRLPDKILCLTRDDRPADEKLQSRLADHDVEWGIAHGQTDLLDRTPPFQLLPEQAMDTISTWLARVSPAKLLSVEPLTLRPDVWFDSDDGPPVVESAFITGPAHLFGIATEPLQPHGGPTIVFINVSNEHRIGPNRLWVDLARRWARMGFRSVRFDLSGLGDSGVWDGETPGAIRVPENFDDVQTVARYASPSDPSDVVLVGLCSSAYQAIDSAFELRPRGVCAINPIFSFSVPEMDAGQPMDPRRRVARHRSSLVTAFSRSGPLWPLMQRFPKALWFARNLLSSRRPARWLEELVANDVVNLYLFGEWEVQQVQRGSARTLDKLTSTGRLTIQVMSGMDHSLMLQTSREMVTDEFTRHISEHFVGPRPVPTEKASSRKWAGWWAPRGKTSGARRASDQGSRAGVTP